MAWSPGSWREYEARQQPVYDDPAALEQAERRLAARPPLVTFDETEQLKAALARAQSGGAFLLQAGDCAERFDRSTTAVEADLRLLETMAGAIARSSRLPVIAVGRIAGQFAKPRTQEYERRHDIALPAWRGDLINGGAFDPRARRADPERLLRGYSRAAATLATLRRRAAPVYASHEALLLPYEEALVRRDPATGRFHGASAHMLWIGDRTLFPGSAHVEFARGLANPVGVKCGPTLKPDMLPRLLDRLDPAGEPGRIVLISRMGKEGLAARLPPLLRAVRRSGRPVLWACDPMHGNTRRTAGGAKMRPLAFILAEARAFFEIAAAEGVFGGGLHVETTAEDVLECTAATGERPSRAPCDPRLNRTQALELAASVGRAVEMSAAGPPLALASG